MPRCPNCGDQARSYDLIMIGNGIVCSGCRRPKIVEGKMAEKKQVVSLVLNEIPTPDNATDHEIAIKGGYGGLEIRFSTTFDKVRTFFTQQRERGKKAKLQSVK
jgi:DNA-directed RNA polymerase subunit RPC12/RpoP